MMEIHVEPTLFVFLGPDAAQVGCRLKQRLLQAYGPLPLWRFLWVGIGSLRGGEAEAWVDVGERAEPGPVLGDQLRVEIEALQRQETLEATEALSDESMRYLVERPGGRPGVRAFIVFALGDREASALSFKVAYLCRHLLREAQQTIVSIALLPLLGEGVVDEAQGERLRANAYAWFREHENLLHSPLWEAQGPDGERIRLETPPFDLSFVVDLSNQAGERLASADEAYAMVALALFLFAGAPASAMMPAREGRVAPLRSRFQDRFRAYSSLAAAALVYPWENVLGYCRATFAGAMLSDGLLAEPAAGQVQAAVQELLERMGLGERAILEALRAGYSVPGHEPSVVSEVTTVQAALSQAQAQEERHVRLRREREPKLDEVVAELQIRTKSALEAEVPGLVISRGVPFARAVLGQFRAEMLRRAQDDAVQALRASLDEAKGKRQAAQVRLDGLDRGIRQALRKIFAPRAWRRDLAASRDELLHWVEEIGRLEVAFAVQGKAQALYTQLGAEAEELEGRLGRVQKTLEGAQQSLRRIAEGYLREPAAERGVFQLSTQALGAGYIRRYYGERVRALSALLAYRDWAADLAGKTLADLEAWEETDLVQRLQERANAYFVQELEGASLLEALDSHYGMQSPAMIEIQFNELLKRCQPFWRYDAGAAIRPSEGRGLFGVEDAGSTLVPGRYRWGEGYVLVSTRSKQRLEAAYTEHGLPAFLLRDMAEYKACYEKLCAEGGDVLHALSMEQLAVDVFPDKAWEARETFALAAALDMIVQLGGWHYFDPQREYARERLRPGRDLLIDQRRDWAEEAFVMRADWVAQAKRLVEKAFADMGREEALRLLEGRIAQYRELARGMPDELRRQYEREMRILEERRDRLLGE